MAFPIKKCVICGEKFELRPDKPGFANRCPDCTDAEEDPRAKNDSESLKGSREQNAERRKAMKDLLYRKDR